MENREKGMLYGRLSIMSAACVHGDDRMVVCERRTVASERGSVHLDHSKCTHAAGFVIEIRGSIGASEGLNCGAVEVFCISGPDSAHEPK